MSASLRPSHSGASRRAFPALARLNAVMSQRFAGLATSPVPVLLPFDTAALLRDQADGAAATGNERYLSGFHAAKFFYPGPAGYDAAFAIRTSDVAELSDIKFPEPDRSADFRLGAALRARHADQRQRGAGAGAGGGVSRHPPADPRTPPALHLRALRRALCRVDRLLRGQRVPRKDADLPVRRTGRAAFSACAARRRRHAAPLACGQAAADRTARASCRQRSAIMGPARSCPAPASAARAAAWTTRSIRRFAFRSPKPRPTPIRRCSRAATGRRTSDPDVSPNYAYPWRDNFCERRGFAVGQCPVGIGHQGQDIRPAHMQAAAGRGPLRAARRPRRRPRRRHPALAEAGGRLSLRQLRQRAHPFSLSAHEPEQDGRRTIS